MGLFSEELPQTIDLEAHLVRRLDPEVLTALSWTLCVGDVDSTAAWELIGARPEPDKAEWQSLPSETKAMLYESLMAAKEMQYASWAPGGGAAAVIDRWGPEWSKWQDANN